MGHEAGESEQEIIWQHNHSVTAVKSVLFTVQPNIINHKLQSVEHMAPFAFRPSIHTRKNSPKTPSTRKTWRETLEELQRHAVGVHAYTNIVK